MRRHRQEKPENIIIACKIIRNSCLDLTEDVKRDPRFQMIPLTLQAGGAQVMDDETFNQKRFIEAIRARPECPKAARLSPETSKAAFEGVGAEAVFVITLSSHLGGSYNSVTVVKKLYKKEMTEKGIVEQVKKVAVINSLPVSSGESNIALFIQSLCGSGLEFDEVVGKTLAYRDSTNTHFVLESLDALRKNERLSGLQAFFATVPSVKPVIDADTGTVIEPDQARGMNKVLQEMCDTAVKEVVDTASKIAVVCYVSNPEQAEYVKDELAKRMGSKKIVITNTAGAATIYANDGGIILAV